MNELALTTNPIECAACGVSFATVRESMDHSHMASDGSNSVENELFESIWQQEMTVRGAKAQVAFRKAGTPSFVMDRDAIDLKNAQKELNRMIDGLSPEEMKSYGEYRKGILAEIKAKYGS